MDLIERQKKGLKKSNETNKLKGLRTFVKNTYTKQDKIYNELLDELIKSGYYKEIYNNKFLKDDNQTIPIKDYDILELMNFCEPDELPTKYRGFYIEKLDVLDGDLTKKL